MKALGILRHNGVCYACSNLFACDFLFETVSFTTGIFYNIRQGDCIIKGWKILFCVATTEKIKGCEPSHHRSNSFAPIPLYKQSVLFPSGGFMPKNLFYGPSKIILFGSFHMCKLYYFTRLEMTNFVR